MPRTKQQLAVAKRMLKKPKGKLEEIDLKLAPAPPPWMTRVYRNNHYVVMIDDNEMTLGIRTPKMMIQRHDDKPIPKHWRELQDIKNEIFGRESTAIEFYPPESELTDQANIYWLWILPPDARMVTGNAKEIINDLKEKINLLGWTLHNYGKITKDDWLKIVVKV